MQVNPLWAKVFWYIGTPLHLIFLLIIMYRWFHKEFQVQTINPAWFIPVVGPIIVPVSGMALHQSEISWFYFSIGLIFWLILFTIIFYRILFHSPIPTRLIPTFFILIAPPAVGFIAYVKMTGHIDPFAKILYYFALFTTLLLFIMIDRFRKLPFFISWWAYTFPMDAITLATFLMYKTTKLLFFKYLGVLFLVLTCFVILIVLVKTIIAMYRHEICVEE